MNAEARKALKSFSIELPLYAVFVAAYVALVLHFLGGWLYQLFKEERKLYAVVALGLIIGQGYFLELGTRALLGLVKRKAKRP